MYPQFLITLDEETEEKAVTVRVGQAVNTVGLAGTRMGISGVSQHEGLRSEGLSLISTSSLLSLSLFLFSPPNFPSLLPALHLMPHAYVCGP